MTRSPWLRSRGKHCVRSRSAQDKRPAGPPLRSAVLHCSLCGQHMHMWRTCEHAICIFTRCGSSYWWSYTVRYPGPSAPLSAVINTQTIRFLLLPSYPIPGHIVHYISRWNVLPDIFMVKVKVNVDLYRALSWTHL